jgi:hypothetical protein
MPSHAIHHTHAGACYAAHPATRGRHRLRARRHPSAAASPPAESPGRARHPAAPPGVRPDPRPPDDPVGAALGLLALAVEVCADEVAHLLARPTPSARRPGPVVRFVGPSAA